jgi:hypothetical protein
MKCEIHKLENKIFSFLFPGKSFNFMMNTFVIEKFHQLMHIESTSIINIRKQVSK